MDNQSFTSYMCVVKSGKILLLRRKVGFKVWEFPGGGIEFGESPEEAAVRETKEESMLDVKSTGLHTVGSTVTPQGKHHIFFCYKCVITGGKEGVGDEDHDLIGWFSMEEMGKLPDLSLSVKSVMPELKKLIIRQNEAS
jgi:8-oxo-dGTP diphosphatase